MNWRWSASTVAGSPPDSSPVPHAGRAGRAAHGGLRYLHRGAWRHGPGLAEPAPPRAIRLPPRDDRRLSRRQHRAPGQTVVCGSRPTGIVQSLGLDHLLPSLALRVSANNFRVPLGWAGTPQGRCRRPSGSFMPIGRPVDPVALRHEIIRTLADYLLDLRAESEPA